MTRLSICIPTYNRPGHLANCLESIRVSRAASDHQIEVCVSDNGSSEETARVVREAQERMRIVYHRNTTNLGIPRNFLNVVAMAEGEFVWLLGDDDLVLPEAIKCLCSLLEQHTDVDFFFVNSFHLTTEYVLSYPQPFSTKNLPEGMIPFSSWTESGPLTFFELINPRRTFDFLGGMFLSVFRREKWLEHVGALDASAIVDPRTFSAFDNTFPHVKIFARAFAGAKAFFYATPVSVCLTGAREWAPKYPMVRSVRLVEALVEYRRNGLPLRQYLTCRNFALRTFLPDLAYMALNRRTSGYEFIQPGQLILANALYPNLYLSVVYYIFRKARTLAAWLGRAAG